MKQIARVAGMKILVIDDEIEILTLVSDLLESFGYSVLKAGDGLKAIEQFQKFHNEIDLVILDQIMPGYSSLDTFLGIKQIDDAVPVLLSSGYDRDKRTEKLLQQGMVGFLQKPYKMNDLVSAVLQYSRRTGFTGESDAQH